MRITSATVYAGDRIEVRPKKLIRQERKVPDPVTSRTSETVCTQTVAVCTLSDPIIEHRCQRKCKVCDSCDLFGCRPDVCCHDECQDVHTGDRCLMTENRCVAQEARWKDQTQYAGLGDPAPKDDPEPMKSVARLNQSIRLKLESLDYPQTVSTAECALGQFKPAVNGDVLVFTLGNVPGCPALFPDPSAGKALTLINQMSVTGSYQEGNLVKTQDGSVLEKPQSKTYDIPLDFVGSFTIVPGPSRPATL